MSFSLSTAWNASRYDTGSGMLLEISGLGFSSVELGFNLTSAMVDDAVKAVERQEICVSSVHNFCPVPEGVERFKGLPDCFAVSSPDPTERELAVKFAKRSIDTAVRLRAKAMVMHCGRVEMPDRTAELIKMLLAGGLKAPELIRDRDEFRLARERISGAYLSQTLRSLDELAAYASKRQIKLGIENRFYYREIPTFDETAIIFQEFKGSGICYWYDTGHGKIMENLGFVRPGDFLRRYSSLVGGVHLHSVKDCKDHLPPCPEGDVDFRALASVIDPNAVKVIEAHKPATGEQLKQSLGYLEEVFNGR